MSAGSSSQSIQIGPAVLFMNIPAPVVHLNLFNFHYKNDLKNSKECVFMTDLNLNFIDEFLSISNGFIKIFSYRFLHNFGNLITRKVGEISIQHLISKEFNHSIIRNILPFCARTVSLKSFMVLSRIPSLCQT